MTIDQNGPRVMGIPVNFGNLSTPADGMTVGMVGIHSSGVFYATSVEAEPIAP